MSKKEKPTEKPQQEQKIVTRYDRKQQKRREQEEKEKREKKIATIVGIVVVAAIVCLIASFPIRTYLAVNENYVTVDGHKVTRVEFDYNYNTAKNSYMNQYGSYMSYFGLDLSGDLSAQMYSETLTWKDYFEQLAVENIKKEKAMLKAAKAAGFSYDATEEYKEYEEALKEQAAIAGTNLNKFVKSQFGSYATMSRISGYLKDAMVVSAYYNQVAEEKAPSDEEIQSYYNENKDSYDSVDYHLVTIDAVLPTEPTDLADPPEDNTEGTDAADDTQTSNEDGTDGETEPYEPSEAEIAAAMETANEEAQSALQNVVTDGEFMEGQTSSEVNSVIREWLFDASRKQGDSTVIEDTTNHRYFVVGFEKRYLDESPTVDARVIITKTTDAQTILDEWKNGEATEESFAQLYEKYSEEESMSEGGLYEALLNSDMETSLAEWLFDSNRANADTAAITTEDGTHYVLYYVGQNEPEWKLNIKTTLLQDIMTKYLEEITDPIEVVDPKGKLNYLKVEAAQEETATEEDTESTDSSQASEETSKETSEKTTEETSEETSRETERESSAETSESTQSSVDGSESQSASE